jgi:hypothetical protein
MVRKPFPDSATDGPSRLAHLNSIDTVEQAENAVDSLNRPALVSIARELRMPGIARLQVPDLKREIVSSTVERRLDSVAVRKFAGPNPTPLQQEELAYREQRLHQHQ